jgi:hypothetical protein
MKRLIFSPTMTLTLALATAACALDSRYPGDEAAAMPGPAAANEIAQRVILIGDAGEAEPDDPVLAEMKRVADEFDRARTTILFLGDNIYPSGMPPADDPTVEVARARLEAQIDSAIATGATTVFVPGNHDHRGDREQAVIRQSEYIKAYSGGRAELLPRGTCPGPIVRDVGTRLRIIYIDSTWLIEQSRSHACAGGDADADMDPAQDVYDALSVALGSAGDRLVLIAAHHPLTTYGVHGGFFPWQVHLFPLWNVAELRGTPAPYLFPIPVLPTLLYVAPRGAGLYSATDLAHPDYQAMIDGFDAALRPYRDVKVLVAGGHEHNLQILTHQVADGPEVLQVLSGSGSIYPPRSVGVAENTVMASPHSGFLVIDVLKRNAPDGLPNALIWVIEVERPAPAVKGQEPPLPTIHRDFRMWRPAGTTAKEGTGLP